MARERPLGACTLSHRALNNLDIHYYLADEPEDAAISELMDGDDRAFDKDELPEEVALLPLRNTVLYPGVVLPITVGRDRSIRLVKDTLRSKQRFIGVVAQKELETEEPGTEELYREGTLAAIVRQIRMPDGSVTIIIQGRSRFHIDDFTQEEPYFKARISRIQEQRPKADEARALMLSLKQEALRIIELAPNIPSEAAETVNNISNLSFLIHFIAANLNLEVAEKQRILERKQLVDKGKIVLEHMANELKVLELSEEIQSKVKTDLDQQQREYMLRQQMRAIQNELGEDSPEGEQEALDERAEKKQWPQAAKEAFDRERSKLKRLNPASPEYGVTMGYLEWMLDLPWEDYTEDRLDLAHARKVLERDHHGLERVKERILEYLAVLQLKQDMKAPILCLYGPPGVGKTSLGRSIAEALNRQFVRMSLGGVRDEAEIRGHRRTYIGAMPGRILQGLRKAKSGNPVMMLDEIDKLGNDFRGDPSSALLEVLDPEQNTAFNDHYLELDYDLSPVLFIATANSLDSIHPALRDRMEIIEVTGYTQEEKVQIGQKHLMPKAREEHGLKASQLRLSAKQMAEVIDGYTRESGVRQLKQQLDKLARGVAKRIVLAQAEAQAEDNGQAAIKLNRELFDEILGPKRFDREAYQRVDSPGVAVGLAWTPVGGEILFIESALTPGKGKLSLTGQLGDVMKESAHVAYIYLKAHAETWGIAPTVFDKWDVHLHIPAGAIPKDGPSAGIALLSALASAFSQRKLRAHLAMTGEITLRGKVLPVGGIKEKLLAAARSGMTEVILSKANKKDVEEIKSEHIGKLDIHYVEQMAEVLALALEDKPVRNALDLSRPVTPAV